MIPILVKMNQFVNPYGIKIKKVSPTSVFAQLDLRVTNVKVIPTIVYKNLAKMVAPVMTKSITTIAPVNLGSVEETVRSH